MALAYFQLAAAPFERPAQARFPRVFRFTDRSCWISAMPETYLRVCAT